MRQHIENMMKEAADCGELGFALEVGTHVDGTYWARLRSGGANLGKPGAVRTYPMFDRAGDCELVGHGATIDEALAQLDVVCSRPAA